MKIAFYLAHPAHFHLFKFMVIQLKQGHDVSITYNEKDILSKLIFDDNFKKIAYNIKSNRKWDSYFGLVNQFISKEKNLYKVLREIKPDIVLGTSIIIAHISKLLKYKSIIVNEDDFDVVSSTTRIGYPFADCILAPLSCNPWKWSSKTIQYNGYHELAYLHPKHFKPDRAIIDNLFSNSSKYFILRFAKLNAHHDAGKTGITAVIAQKIIDLLKPYGNIFITSERELEPQFEKYRIKINPLNIHHALYFADMYIGDSQTMAIESAVMGTPSLRFNDFVGRIGILEELEHKYGLTYGIKTSEPEKLFSKIDELLNTPDIKEGWQKRRQKMLSEKIDVTAFMVWFIENYPESVKIMKENPDYQYNFK